MKKIVLSAVFLFIFLSYQSYSEVAFKYLEKNKLIEKINNLELDSESPENNINTLKEIQKEWTEIGFIPAEDKDRIQNLNREALNKKFENLNIDENKKKMFRYKVKIDQIKNSKAPDDKIYSEKNKLLGKLKKLQSDVVLLENNIGFFAKSASAEALISDIKNKIENGKKEIEIIQKQIHLLEQAQ